MPPAIPKARLTVNRTAIWQPTHGAAEEVCPHRSGSFVRLSNSDEQPYRRTISVGVAWQPLDFGWCGEDGKTPAHVFVINEEGQFHGGQPTPEVRDAVLALTVEIAVSYKPGDYEGQAGFTRARVYESAQFEPLPGKQYFLRCPAGPARVTVVAVPGDGS